MTLGTLVDRLLQEAGESDVVSPVTFSRQEARDCINEAQRLFVLFTLCLEAQTTMVTTAGSSFYYVSAQISDYLAPLRVLYGSTQVRPATLAQLEARSRTWRTSSGVPERYAHLGWDTMALAKLPDAVYSLTVKYARCPVKMTNDGVSPEIPAEDHQVLIDGALPILRLKEGGQQLAKVIPRFDAFLQRVRKRAEFVRSRSKDNQYDSMPPELKSVDFSRLAMARKRKDGTA